MRVQCFGSIVMVSIYKKCVQPVFYFLTAAEK